MKLQALAATGVRNLRPLTLTPRARFSVFSGDNGQGKTNLLEAIFVIATLRSFRTARLADLIAFGADQAQLGARVVKDDLVRRYDVALAPTGRKVTLDGKPARPLARYFGGFNVVVFTPEDLALARAAPADRRRFLDRGVFTLRPDYLAIAQDYERVLRSRNAVLRKAADGGVDRRQLEDLLAVYDRQLADHGARVIAARVAFVDLVRDELAAAFTAITRTGLRASARYAIRASDGSAGDLLAQLAASRAKDLATRATQVGPHRDDLILSLEDRDAGAFASQGQLRAIMLAWKTAELTVIGRAHGDPPILLLDDVSSELDPQRNAYLFEHLAALASQCFITTTHPGHVLLAGDRADYRIRGGEILE